jgi:hypothetical protein
MNEDGIADAVFTMATYPKNIAHPIVVLNGQGPVENIAPVVFPGGVPRIVHANQIFLTDIDGDGREDLLISEAGMDKPPWVNPDAMIGIAINRGGGTFEDVSATVPQAAKGLRNYPLAAGDLFNDGVVRIVLPSQHASEAPHYSGPEKTGLLFWNGRAFEFQQNWIRMSLWWWPENLYMTSFMAVRDIDADGWQDLYHAGSQMTPNHRVLFGGRDFPSAASLVTLPEGPYGHMNYETWHDFDLAIGADVNRAVLEDFDEDGDLDIVSIMEEVQNYKPGVFKDKNYPGFSDVYQDGGTVYTNVWFQVLRHEGQRRFVDVASQGRDLGRRYYIALDPLDLDLDGDLDLLGTYWTKPMLDECKPRWGSTFFVNEGDLHFREFEASDVFPELASQVEQATLWPGCDTPGLGVLFPTEIRARGIKGLFVVPLGQYTDHHELRVFRFEATGRFHIPE